MKTREETAQRLVLRAASPLVPLILLGLALLLTGFGLLDILEERGENGGWFALPLGLLFLALGLFVLVSPVDYVINRAEGTLLHLRRGPFERMLKTHEIPGLREARARSYRSGSSRGSKAWMVQLHHAGGAPVTLPAGGGRRSAERLAQRINAWLAA